MLSQIQPGGDRPAIVQLASERSGLGDTNNYEPEFIKIRAANNYHVYLNSDDVPDTNKVNLVYSTDNTNSVSPQPLISRTKRLTISSIDLMAMLWNVTTRNNKIEFTYNGIDYEAFVTPGVWTDTEDLIDDILTEMNAAVGSPPGATVFTKVAVPGSVSPGVWRVSSTGLPWSISPTCNAVTRGATVYNLPYSTSAVTQDVGPMFLTYPRIIYFSSIQLAQSAKRQSFTTQNIPNVVYAWYNIDKDSYNHQKVIETPAWVNFDSTSNMFRIDMTLYDEFGEYLFVPPAINNRSNLVYSVDLLCEM